MPGVEKRPKDISVEIENSEITSMMNAFHNASDRPSMCRTKATIKCPTCNHFSRMLPRLSTVHELDDNTRKCRSPPRVSFDMVLQTCEDSSPVVPTELPGPVMPAELPSPKRVTFDSVVYCMLIPSNTTTRSVVDSSPIISATLRSSGCQNILNKVKTLKGRVF
jgi:hypothetical protein